MGAGGAQKPKLSAYAEAQLTDVRARIAKTLEATYAVELGDVRDSDEGGRVDRRGLHLSSTGRPRE